MKLELEAVLAGYGAKLVLDGVSFTVPEKGVVTLLGANGCGKSTLLKVIGRLLKPGAGSVLLDGREVRRYDTVELARKMAILPQLHHASGDITVEELVAFGRFPHRRFGSGSGGRDREAVAEAIAVTRLEELRRRPVATLSGGERQRAWIAMTLAQEPQLLLLDEPTTFLDICCQFEVIELIRRLNRERGITVVMVLHDLNMAARYSDQLIAMKDRRIFRAGTPRAVLRPEILREVFEIETEITETPDGVPHCRPTGSARRTPA